MIGTNITFTSGRKNPLSVSAENILPSIPGLTLMLGEEGIDSSAYGAINIWDSPNDPLPKVVDRIIAALEPFSSKAEVVR